MSNTDLAVQLHFALFRGSNGFVLKPLAMRENLAAPNEAQVRDSFVLGSGQRQAGQLTDYFWPSPCDILHRTNIRVVSLHNLPKVMLAPGRRHLPLHQPQPLKVYARHTPERSAGRSDRATMGAAAPPISTTLNSAA
jgi:hypothetical protein